MRLTLAMLFACWTIYSSNISAVLSLPPSLIANAASLHQQQQQLQQQLTKTKREQPKAADNLNGLWHKDVKAASAVVERAATAGNEGGNVLAADIISQQKLSTMDNSQNNAASKAHSRKSRMANIATNAAAVVPIDPRSAAVQSAESAYDLNGFPKATALNDDGDDDDETSDTINNGSAVDEEAPLPQPLTIPQILQPSAARAESNEFFTPLKYWASHCQPDKNCPKQYYRALLTNNRNSNKEIPLIGHPNGLSADNKRLKNFGSVEGVMPTVNHELYDDLTGTPNIGYTDAYDDIATNTAKNFAKDQNRNNDIFMYLNGEQDVIKFLNWAMQLLYPHERFANYSATGADYYHPGMFIWKKLNLSGNLEPPLYAEEPHYIIVRREQLNDDFKMKSNYNNDDPFIPPRGRKHNMPDLDALLHRYETFVPNRGRRDKIKDMLKSDDLFFPNRGKRLKKPPTPARASAMDKRDLEYENGSINHSSGHSEKNQHNKNDDEADVVTDVETDVNIDDNIENESFNNDDDSINNENDNDDDDWNKTLPLALIMRDTLAKLWHKKLQNQHEQQRQQQNAAIAAGNKITRNAHEINYFSDNSNSNNNNNPEWLPAMLNYKFNGYDPAGIIKQSMPMAMTINGETREMSTPKATKNDALMQLMLQQQPQLQQFDVVADVDEIATGSNTPAAPANLLSVDSGAAMIGANSLLSTRSMSTAMAHRRQQQLQHRQHQQQQQLQRQRQLLNQRRLAAMSQELNAQTESEHANNWQEDQKHHQNQPHYHHQVKSFADLVPLLRRQLQLPDNSYNDALPYWQQKRKVQKPFQPRFWPQEALRQNFLSKAQRAGLKGKENSAYFNDYNYFDI